MELPVEARARALEPFALACVRDVLTGCPTADDVDSTEVVGSDGVQVIELLRVGPVLAKHPATEIITLDLPHGLADTSKLETKVQAPDPTAKASDAHTR